MISNPIGLVAPESLKNGIWNFASDVYCLGLVFYTIIFGKNPF